MKPRPFSRTVTLGLALTLYVAGAVAQTSKPFEQATGEPLPFNLEAVLVLVGLFAVGVIGRLSTLSTPGMNRRLTWKQKLLIAQNSGFIAVGFGVALYAFRVTDPWLRLLSAIACGMVENRVALAAFLRYTRLEQIFSEKPQPAKPTKEGEGA